MEPLNGKKIHPLSEHAIGVLRGLAQDGPRPAQEINAGVIRRLRSEDLVTLSMRPSPYRTHPGSVYFAEITAQGRDLLSRRETRPAG